MARSTALAGPPHACSQWTLSSGCGSCSGSGWACGPTRRWHTELPGTEIRNGRFGQPPAEFLRVVLAAWHGGASGQASGQFVLQQVEELDGVVKAVHEQHVVTCEFSTRRRTTLPADSRMGPVAVLDPAHVDFCIENVACLGLAQLEALDVPSDRLAAYVLLDGEEVLGGNHALVEAVVAGGGCSSGEREGAFCRAWA